MQHIERFSCDKVRNDTVPWVYITGNTMLVRYPYQDMRLGVRASDGLFRRGFAAKDGWQLPLLAD